MSGPSLSIYHLEPPAPPHSSSSSRRPFPPKRPINVAVVGCAHGQLSSIYSTLDHIATAESLPIHLLLCCGDFQATRTLVDLSTLSCPPKYRQLSSFARWWNGDEGRVPVLTVYIGGNHEATNVHVELPYGGWVCDSIYYLGLANVVRVAGWRIGGLSGIYKPADYERGHFERLPFTESTMRSVYHVRKFDAWRITQLPGSLDVFMSHDWPRGIERHGDLHELLRRKPFFRSDIESNALGSEAAEMILATNKPRYWFSAHLHVKFPAIYHHPPPIPPTLFLALDKALPGRDYMQIVPLVGEGEVGEVKLQYDLDWLCLVKKTVQLVDMGSGRRGVPRGDWSVKEEDRAGMWEWIKRVKRVESKGAEVDDERLLDVPLNYHKAAATDAQDEHGAVRFVRNAQSSAFCQLLDMPDVYSDAMEGVRHGERRGQDEGPSLQQAKGSNPDEIDIGDMDDEDDAEMRGAAATMPSSNPDEIDLGDISDD